MKLQELRIGNWVLIPFSMDGVIIPSAEKQVLGIGKFGGIDFTKPEYPDDLIIPAIHCAGIPLTEEWLRKLHNEDEISISKRFPNEITIYGRFLFIWKENYKYWYVIEEYHKKYLTKIEFVHEYQNFIFALTGEELTIK